MPRHDARRPRPLSGRRVLAKASAIALAGLIAAACGSTAPSASPTVVAPTPWPSSTSSSGAPATIPLGTATATPGDPTAIPPASASPSPTASASATASPTPTQAPTPTTSAGPSVAPVGGIIIEAKEYTYHAPATVRSGLVPVTLRNIGTEPHQAQLVHLRGDKTLKDLAAAVKDPTGARLFEIVDVTGGPEAIGPAQSQTTMQTLQTGLYGILCFVRGTDGVPHVAKGMLGGFAVAPPDTGNVPPAADVDVTATEYSYTLPATLTTGSHTLKLTNSGQQAHELLLARLDAGKSLNDAIASIIGPGGAKPPWTEVGGMGALAPGATGYVTWDALAPGRYVAMCFLPDPGTGKPHAAIGMISKVEVP